MQKSPDPQFMLRAKQSQSVSQFFVSPAKAVQGARIIVQWCRFALPAPPLPHSLCDKLVLLWSLATLMITRATQMVVSAAEDGAENDVAHVGQVRELLSSLGTVFLSLCHQGEKAGFFQKLAQKNSITIEMALLLRCFGTLLVAVVAAINESQGVVPTPAQVKERQQIIEKLTELKKTKAYQSWTSFIDVVLASNLRMNPTSCHDTIRECVSTGLRTVVPHLSLCTALILNSDVRKT
jgi:hypothetical protein